MQCITVITIVTFKERHAGALSTASLVSKLSEARRRLRFNRHRKGKCGTFLNALLEATFSLPQCIDVLEGIDFKLRLVFAFDWFSCAQKPVSSRLNLGIQKRIMYICIVTASQY